MTAVFFTLLFALFSCYRCESNFSYDYYPTFHLGPLISSDTEVGWMNDPNGFSYYKGLYHLFYQYNPKSSVEPGIAHWGHATSQDLVTWEHLPIALYPDTAYDTDGVFSGSALIEDDTMYLFYTGNDNHPGQTPDHEQHQLLAATTDSLTFTKYDKPIIYGLEHQPNFRDPKVWKDGDTYYMVLGNSFNNNTLGRVLLYSSKDILNWKQVSVLAESDGSLGYMWECPDFFELDGLYVLLFSPQGVKPEGDNYLNLYQTGYIIGNYSKETGLFSVKQGFKEMDHGHDYYATQSMIDKQGRRVVIAWLDMWEQNYPEGQDGFTGQMTIARTLKLTCDGLLLQQPIPEMKKAVGKTLYSGKACTKVTLENNTGRIEIHSPKKKDFTVVIESESGNGTVKLSYNHKEGLMTFDRGGNDGVRRTEYTPVRDQFKIVIYIDKSSFEAFIDRGEVTFSSRFFLTGQLSVRVEKYNNNQFMKVNAMKRTVPSPTSQIGN